MAEHHSLKLATMPAAPRAHGVRAKRPWAPRLLWVLVGAGVLFRIILVLTTAGGDAPTQDLDSRDYLQLADHLGQLFSPPDAIRSLSVFHPPGYPAVARVGVALGGTSGILAVQIVLSALALVATFAVGRKVGGEKAGLLATGIVAVDPLSVIYTGQVLTETTFTAVLMGTLWLLLVAWERASWQLALLAGVVLGFAVLVRPIASYLPILLVPATVLAVSAARMRKAIVAIALLIGFAIPVGTWVGRNVDVAGGPMVSSVDSYNLLAYRAAGAVSSDDGTSLSATSRRLVADERAKIRPGDSEYDIAKLYRNRGLSLMADHPLGLAKSSARGFAHVMIAPGLGILDAIAPGLPHPIRTLLAALSAGIAVVALLGAGYGAGVACRRRQSAGILLALVAAYLIVVSSGPEGESRFRVPILPLLAVLSAAALLRLAGYAKGRYASGGWRRQPGAHRVARAGARL